MSFENEVEIAPSSDAVAPEKAPKKSIPLPTSPLRMLCVYLSYDEQQPDTGHMPWAGHKDLASGTGVDVKDSDKNGFIQGQKLAHYRLKPIFDQEEEVFPKCMGRNRMWMEDDLYPQYGDLHHTMFKPKHNQRTDVLERRREELIQEMKAAREELIEMDLNLKGPWVPGTEEWKKAAGKVKKEAKGEIPVDEMEADIDEMQEKIEVDIDELQDEMEVDIDELQDEMANELLTPE
jgi:hypothetical protein